MKYRFRNGLLVALTVVSLAFAFGCGTLAPGARAEVVRIEQGLTISQAIYDNGLDWCRANAASFSPGALVVVNKVRTGFPPLYRAIDSGLQLYKAGSGPLPDTSEIDNLIAQLEGLIAAVGGPDFRRQANAKAGGK